MILHVSLIGPKIYELTASGSEGQAHFGDDEGIHMVSNQSEHNQLVIAPGHPQVVETPNLQRLPIILA